MSKLSKNPKNSNFKSLSDVFEKIEKLEKIVVNLYNAVLIERTAVSTALHGNISKNDYIRKETAYRKYRRLGEGLTTNKLNDIVANNKVKLRRISDSRSKTGFSFLLNEYELVQLLTLEERDKIVCQKQTKPSFDIAALRLIAKGKGANYENLS